MKPIPVTERLPEIKEDHGHRQSEIVLAWGRSTISSPASGDEWFMARLRLESFHKKPTWTADAPGIGGYECEYEDLIVTHWLPLPEPPE